MIEVPIYLNGTEANASIYNGALFHYTKFESFLKIIKTMTIRSSSLSMMNDLNEANIDSLDWNADFMMMCKAEEYVKEKCSIISFSRNCMTEFGRQEGSNHPAMWAHYADDFNGVCIVLDTDSLVEANKDLLEGTFYKLEPVSYSINCAPKNGIEDKSYNGVSDFIQTNYKELFYKKHIDWSYEKEVRFLIEKPEVFLNIKGAIKYIVLGCRLKKDEGRLLELVKNIISPGEVSYRYINLYSFAEMSPNINGYSTDSAYSTLRTRITNYSILSKEYLDWHRDKFSESSG